LQNCIMQDKSRNSDNFDLSEWYLTLPVDKSGDTDGKALTVKNLKGYEDSDFFYDSSDKAMVFRSPVKGARTSKNTKYTRTELRELMNGERAAWTLQQGGMMTATLKVDEVPSTKNGKKERIIVGQIHGKDDELVRLYFEDGEVYFMNEHSKEDGKEHRFDPVNAQGKKPNVSLGEVFSYKIHVYNGDTLLVDIIADGQTYRSVTSPLDDFWENDRFYFKAGLYMGVNEKMGSGYGQVSFYELDVQH